jgi:hypothetical protein
MNDGTEIWPLILGAAFVVVAAMAIGAVAAVTLIPKAPPCHDRSDVTWRA